MPRMNFITCKKKKKKDTSLILSCYCWHMCWLVNVIINRNTAFQAQEEGCHFQK